MNDDSTLREKAREALRSGTLPTRKPDRLLGGLGRGGACALCGDLLTLTLMEMEMEFSRQGTTPGLASYLLHPRCFAAWEFVRKAIEADPDAPLSDRRDPDPQPSRLTARIQSETADGRRW